MKINNRPWENSMIARKAFLVLFDVLCLCVLSALLLSGVPAPAYAYVDPSVMTYTIQAVAGVAVALSAVAGVVFRKSRKRIMKLLNIDENAKKAVDPKWSEVKGVKDNRFNDCGTGEYLSRVAVSGPDNSKIKEQENRVPLLRRLLLALAVSAFMVVTVFVIAPFEILAGNEGSLAFNLVDAWRPLLIAAGGVFAVVVIILTVLRGKAFNCALLVVFCFALGCYVQALFLNAGLPSTDGRPINWTNFKVQAIVSALVWVAVFVVPFVLSWKKRAATQVVVALVAVALVIVQGTAAVSLMAGKIAERVAMQPGEVPASMYRMTENGMYSVSPDKNVIVFVLDTYDTTDMIRLTEEDPELSQKLQGFTWFKNSVGSLCPTRYGAAFLWTGVYPEADEEFVDYIQNRYRKSTFLDDVLKEGYSIGLYTDPVGDFNLPDKEKRDLIYDKTINIEPPAAEATSYLNETGTVKIMLQASLYRNLPWFAKPFVYFNTDQVNQAMAIVEENVPSDNPPYIMNDAQWYAKLKGRGLSFEEGDSNGAYRFIHLNGTHIPYNLDAEGNNTGRETSLDEQARGSLKMVMEYLEELKRLGVYEDATIIITADHGIWWECPVDQEPFLSSPLMLVKPAGVSEGELQVSEAEITAYDVLPTVIDAIGGDASAYGPTIFEQPESGRDRRYIFTHTVSNVDVLIQEFRVDGDALDPSSWSATGVEWDGSNVPH